MTETLPESAILNTLNKSELYYSAPTKKSKKIVNCEPTVGELLDRLAEIIVDDYINKIKIK
jgi:hypothetical protein